MPGQNVFQGIVDGRAVAFQTRVVPNGVHLQHGGASASLRVLTQREAELDALMPKKAEADTSKALICPMPGLVKSLVAKSGQRSKAGETLCIVEAIDGECAPRRTNVTITAIYAKEGESIAGRCRDYGILLDRSRFMPIYFAYGLLMSPANMAKLIPRRVIHRYWAATSASHNYRMKVRVFLRCEIRVAQCMALLIDVPLADILSLDRLEGVAAGRAQKSISRSSWTTAAKRALLHLVVGQHHPLTAKDREALGARSARSLGLDDAYVIELVGIKR